MHTSDTARSDWAANSAASSAARLARSAALLARSRSLSCSHAVFPQALHAPYSPWARASSRTHLHPRFSADHEDFGTSDNAGVDEDYFARGVSSKAESFVDEPLVDNKLHDFWSCLRGRPGGWLRVLRLPADSVASLLTATSAVTWSFLSRRTRNSTIRRISRRSWVQSTTRSSAAVAWR